MTYVRKRLSTVGTQDAVLRLLGQIRAENRMFPGEEEPTLRQVAMVLHALADHTLIQEAMRFDQPEGPWPLATSVGRFLHAYGDRFSTTALEVDE